MDEYFQKFVREYCYDYSLDFSSLRSDSSIFKVAPELLESENNYWNIFSCWQSPGGYQIIYLKNDDEMKSLTIFHDMISHQWSAVAGSI